MLAALAIALLHLSLATAAPWHGAHISLSGPSRNLLNEKPTGIRLSQVSLAATPLSELLKDRKLDASMSTDPGFSKANPAELVAAKRPFKIAFYDRLDKSRTAAEHEYIMGRLMPAAANVLASSMRIRTPSGILPFVGFKNPDGSPISPPPPSNDTDTTPEGIDADIFMEVTSMPAKSEECEGVIAGAIPAIFEDVTYRPIFGIVRLCHVDEEKWESDVATVVHELMHALGFGSFAFPIYPGYEHGLEDFTVMDTDGGMIITSPNVKAVTREHFGCDSLRGAEFEDDGASGTVNSHWEERIFQGELLDAGDTGNANHHNRHIISDVTLALLQDTNWYDVKYGSAGWNSYGYHGGCAFASGTRKEAMADPKARKYLCTESQDWSFMCTHDHSGDGVCISDPVFEGFKQVQQFDAGAVDCMGGGNAPGTRCIQGKKEFFPECVKMACSDDGMVLIGGKPCDKKTMQCPDDDLMCGDPGLLTCAETLNDCSGMGDCYKGSCYCHTGWGGADCSIPVCYDKCDDGSDCPASGFCGVEECGTWSSGSDDRGTPCNTAAGVTAGDLDANATTDAGDGEPGVIVTSIADAGKGVKTSGFAATVDSDNKPKERRMPPPGMMRNNAGQRVFGPEDVPADIPDVMMLDASRSADAHEGDGETELNLLATSADENGEDEGKTAPVDDSVAAEDAERADEYGDVGEDAEEDEVEDQGAFSDDVTADEDIDDGMDEVVVEDADGDMVPGIRGYSPSVQPFPCGVYGDEC